MNKKVVGIIACTLLVILGVLFTSFYNDKPYSHQYDEEDSIGLYAFEEIDDYYTNIRVVDEENYCLDDYFFSNLAGDVMDLAPVVKYAWIDDELYIIQENYLDCIKDSEYIIKIDPLDTMKEDDTDRIVTFIDYSYLSKDGRYIYPIYNGKYTVDEIKSELSHFEKCLYSYDYQDEDYGHQNKLNERNFVDYFIMFELAYPGYYSEENFVVYKDTNNRFRVLTSSFLNSSDKTYKDDVEYHNLISTSWYLMLCKSKIFTDAVISEYEYLRKNDLSNDNIAKVLDKCTNFLMNSEGINTNEVMLENEKLKTYLDSRLAWLDENIYSMKGFSAYSAIKEYNNTPY